MIVDGIISRLRKATDFSYERTFGYTNTFPTELFLDINAPVPDQWVDGNPTACTGYTQARISSFEDGRIYDPVFTYNKTLEIIGKQGQKIGVQITDSIKSTQVFGLKGFDETEDQAFSHKRGAYFDVDRIGDLDYFDGARSAMTLSKAPLSMGTTWYGEWEPKGNGLYGAMEANSIAPMPGDLNRKTGGHNYMIAGWKMISGLPYLIAVPWQGSKYADNGRLYIGRGVFNAVMDVWGTQLFRFEKATPADVQVVKRSTLEVLLSLYQQLLALFASQPAASTPSPAIPTPPIIPPTYDWSTVSAARHSVRLICDEENLTYDEKNELCATVQCESGLRSSTIHPNIANGVITSTDYGICQINDYFHIGDGKDFPSKEYVLSNPEACIRWMCKQWKRGEVGKKLWVCYSANLYQKYL